MFHSNYNYSKSSVCSLIGYGIGTGWLYRSVKSRSSNRRNGRNIINNDNNIIYIVSVAHCIFNNDNEIIEPRVLIHNINNTGDNCIFDTKVISYDKKGDIVLLEILQHQGINKKYPLNWPNHTSLVINTTRQSIGSQIYTIGYPLGFDFNSFSSGFIRENNASFSETPTSYYYNMATYSGNSGSPVLNNKNDVIGMLQWGINDYEDINGGIIGEYLYHFLETSIDLYIQSNKTLYHHNFKKNYIEFFENRITTFQPLSVELIILLQEYLGYGTIYNNSQREVNGIILIHNYFYTSLVLEEITYTDINNKVKNIVLSSCIFDKSSIWDVIYFGKKNSSITCKILDISNGNVFYYSIYLKEMPEEIDMYLTSSFSHKNIYNNIIVDIKNDKENTISKIKNNSYLMLKKLEYLNIDIQNE